MTILSTWNFDCGWPLLSCGIDAERSGRFKRFIGEPGAMPFVFTKRELDHCSTLADPAAGLCRSFCCKEAVFKALGIPYRFTDCELLSGDGDNECDIGISPDLRRQFAIRRARALIRNSDGEVVVAVYLFGGSLPMENIA